MRKTKRNILMIALAVIIAATLLFSSMASAMAAYKLSNEKEIEGKVVDGIDSDPEVGMHNSYAWCAALFEQTDGDYLWVGTNRDLGGTIIGAALGSSAPDIIYNATEIPRPSTDNAGKIYRYKMNSFEPQWELMYEDPAINGYRKMLIFKGDLYVFAGLTNAPKYHYSAVYRFKPDFKKGDTPDIVLWENLSGATEYFRAAYIYNDMLYVGTFDSKIYCTDGSNLKSLTPKNLPNAATAEDKRAGWTLFVDLKTETGVFDVIYNPGGWIQSSYIWDIIGFNGYIYAFATGDGFRVYKMTINEDKTGYDEIVQIAGNKESALYPAGIGIGLHVAASPFIFNIEGEDYVYVSTFANGPTFLGAIAQGRIEEAFENLYCPATMYRFDKDDTWEVVVGDTTGEYVAKDKSGNPLNHVGNNKAGFFAGSDLFTNASANQYIWWMAEFEGKIYASTWDMGVFRDKLPLMILNIFIQEFNQQESAAIMSNIADLIATAGALYQVAQNIPDIYNTVSEEITILLSDFVEAAQNTDTSELSALLDQLLADITDLFTPYASEFAAVQTLIQDLQASAQELYTIISTSENTSDAFAKAMSATFACALFLGDNSNPAGFDLFVSKDGVNFEPYTVTGFNDPYNYGGRVILPTEKYGLFVMTANPFYGCQVWQLGDVKPAIIANTPNPNVRMDVNGTFKFYVKSIGLELNASDLSINKSELSVTISLVRELDPIKEYNFSVEKVSGILTYGEVQYAETYEITEVPVYIYEVTVTGLKAYSGQAEITINIGELQIKETFSVIVNAKSDPGNDPDTDDPDDPGVDKPTNPDPLSPWIIAAIIGGVAVLLVIIAMIVYIPKKKRKF